MKLSKRLAVIVLLVAMLSAFLPYTLASAEVSTSVSGKGYMVGNSLTMSMSPRRLDALLATQGYDVTLGGQLLGDTTLPEHIGMRLVGKDFTPDAYYPWYARQYNQNYPDGKVRENSHGGSDTSNGTYGFSEAIDGRYFYAMSEEYFDFVSLQTYGAWVETHANYQDFYRDHTVSPEGSTKEYYEYQYMGDREAIGLMVEYALAQRANGNGADTFLIYEGWTQQKNMMLKKDTNQNGVVNFSEYYNSTYNINEPALTDTKANQQVPNANATKLLMSYLRSDFSYLPDNAIRLVPASAIFARLDEMLLDGKHKELEAAFEAYMLRNANYYLGSRNDPSQATGVQPDELKQNAYVAKYGISNLFTDAVHMASYGISNYNGYTNSNAWHCGEKEGTLASYITVIAMYSVLTGYSPVGLPVDMNTTDRKAQFVAADEGHDARIDPVEDAYLIRVVQETVFEVLCELSEYTGITEDAPQRTQAGTSTQTSAVRTSASNASDSASGVRLVVDVTKAVNETPVLLPTAVTTVEVDSKKKEENI